MDAVLIDHWLSGLDAHYILDAASVTLLQRAVREETARLGLSPVIGGSLVNIASELAHNQLAHARGGRVALRPIERDGVPGLEIIAADEGNGIADPSAALAGTPRALELAPPMRKSLGVGLAAVRELADEIDFDVRVLEGSCIWARKFAASVARRREVGIYGRPYPGEPVSGDQAMFLRDEDSLLLVALDGLGHGWAAREAADLAVSSFRAEAHASLTGMLDSCHGALQKTRGAVATLARVLERQDELEAASVGNVRLHLAGPGRGKHVSGASWVLGSPGPSRKPILNRMPVAARDAVILFSDGLSARFELSQELDLLREHPIIIAHRLLQRFARANDDALVLVAR